MKWNIDFLDGASNVYRTKKYIVNQKVSIKENLLEDQILFSRDTYYQRTKLRDKQFNKIFKDRSNIDGKRLYSTAYLRKYID